MSQKIYSLRLNNSDEVRYIGQTNLSLTRRLNGHKSEVKVKINKKKKLNHKDNWIKKNKENIQIELIEEFNGSQEELDTKEIHYIKLFKSFGAKLLNFTDGGNGCLSKPSKLKGIKRSLEFRENARKGQLGRKQSKEMIEKRLSKTRGRKNTQETKDLIRSLMKPEHLAKLSKTILQYNLNGEFIAEFPSVMEASRKTGVNKIVIYRKAQGITKNSSFIWKYKV